MTAHYAARGRVAVITLDNPPVNGLGHATRTALMQGLDRAKADAAIGAVVITGANGLFSGGADIREFGTPKALAEPTLLQLITTVESYTKPVVAAIHGTCMGGGLELSLGCHYRVAAPDAKVALPEVKLGLLPGAGGTQRLPRAVGVERTLEMIVSGNPVTAAKLRDTKLFDAIIEGDFLEGAVKFAERLAVDKRPTKRLRDVTLEAKGTETLFAAAREKAAKGDRFLPAPKRCIDAIEAAVVKPFDEGIRFEREAFLQLMASPESKALRHAFFGERTASKIPDVPADTPVRAVKSVAVIGAGTMGGGIAMAFLNAGFPVTLLETKQEALDRGVANIRKQYEGSVAKGRLDAADKDKRLANLKPTLSHADIATADLVIEAVFEEMAVKEEVFRKLDATVKPGAILATNTSTLDVNRIAAATKRPQDVVGLHFFSPANVMRLLEVVRGKATAKDVLATAMQLARKLGKVAVVSGVCDGFIGNRMVEQYLRQSLFLLEEGATPAQVDRALEAFGFAMGPFRMSDLAGNDIGWAIRKRRYAEKPDLVYPRIADRLCELGRFGQKTGAGWYAYQEGSREATPDAKVDAMIADYRREKGLAARAIPDDEIVQRCVFALVNEGAQILDEGIAARASDIDMVYLTGYGFPRHRGGPMLHADMVGLPTVLAAVKRFTRPAPLLERLAAEGKTFS